MAEASQMISEPFKIKYRQKGTGILLWLVILGNAVVGNTDTVSTNVGTIESVKPSVNGCQCNGRITCLPNTGECIEPCANFTHGPQCEKCIPGYYGNPLNGDSCQPCSCNNHATQCTSVTGKCFCETKGIIGDHCDICDSRGHYYGDPKNNGTCFYDLTTDYQFIFNLSKKEDRHFRAINFKNSPLKQQVNVDFSIKCSVMAKMNITFKTANNPEKPLLLGANCTTYKILFNSADYNFGLEDDNPITTFYVYVYDLQVPLWIQISFAQYSGTLYDTLSDDIHVLSS